MTGNLHLGVMGQRLLGQRTGVGRYLHNLMREWATSPIPFERVTLFTPEPLPEGLIPENKKIKQRQIPPKLTPVLWEQLWSPLFIKDIDVLFCPSYTIPLLYRGPSVVVTHDMLQETRKGDFPWHSRIRQAPFYRYSARQATRVITMAEATRSKIGAGYGVPLERIIAIPEATDPLFHAEQDEQDSERLAKLGIEGGSFVLFVGKLSLRRHAPDLIEAFAKVSKELTPSTKLVLAGPNPMRIPIREIARRHEVERRVFHFSFVDDQELASLYRGAELFIYPSEEEGFGLPILEAMTSGTPVITLRRPAIAEVAGEAAWYAEEGNADGLAEAMRAVLGDAPTRDELRQGGLERAKAFSWERAAKQTMEVLWGVANERGRPA